MSRFKILILAFLFFGSVSTAWAAFLFSVPILTPSQLTQLSDEKLTDAYIEAVVELETVRQFYSTSGFGPKDMDSMKSLIRYRIYLIHELEDRGLKVPRVE